MPADFSVAQHAADLAGVIKQLSWGPAMLECNSGGGPIGQIIAVEHSQMVTGLVLSCTLHRTVEQTRAVLEHWIALAERGDWAAFQWDSIARTFRPRTVARYRLFRSLLRWMPPPRDPTRVIRVLEGLLALDHRPFLAKIACPVLVIGGTDDQVIPRGVQEEMGALIPGSETILYPGYGHGNDQENPDYVHQVERFLALISRQ